MTKWTKEDLYGPNSIQTEPTCHTCSHCYVYAQDSSDPDIVSHHCVLKSTDVHGEEVCDDYFQWTMRP